MAGLAALTLAAGLALVGTPAAAAAVGVPARLGPEPPEQAASVEPRVREQLAAEGKTEFWVYLRDQADLSAASSIADRAEQGWFVYEELTRTAESSQAGLRAMLDTAGADYQPFWIANAVQVTGDQRLLDRIAARPEVAEITADRNYRIPEPLPAQEEPAVQAVEWGVEQINAPQVWDEFAVRGQDILVGSIDTGAQYTHEALVDQYRGNLGGGEFDHNYHWWDPSNICGSPSLEPCDNMGHGTHVTGTMVGDDSGGNQIGVAPQAQWIAAKGCESRNCSTEALLSSGQFMLAPTDLEGNNPDPARRPHVLNNSWGGVADDDPWYQPTVRAWVAAGIFPQFASGNTDFGVAPCGSASNPGNLVESYASGAYDSNGNLADFSNRGPSAWDSELVKPDISAPGVAIRSAWNDGAYHTISGTSMASPHVAGAVALMWSAAPALVRDLDATRELLDLTAVDTEDLTCGGTAASNNMFGEGKLDAYAAVNLSPRGATGTLAGTVTDAETGDPIEGATVAVAGEQSRELTTSADGAYSVTLPVGEYPVTVSGFGYREGSAEASVVADETTTLDFALAPVPSVTVSGLIRDGSGHGWPLYAKVSVEGTDVSDYTNPFNGRYRLRLPAGATYTLQVEPQYPSYAGTTEPVEVGDRNLTRDLRLAVENCQDAPGYEFSAQIGVLGDYNGLLGEYLAGEGIPTTPLDWGDDVSGYEVIVVNRPGDPGQEAFGQFLADTDAAGTGVVFLDTWSTSGNGIWLLNEYLGNPGERDTDYDTSIPYLSYQVTQEHPILDGFAVGDEIVLDETSSYKDHAWFGGYEGEGRTVLADAARGDEGVLGNGIGVQERETNRHVLLSMHGASSYIGPEHWHADGAQVFRDSLEWVSPASFECEQVDGGLVAGFVRDRNTGDGISGATVTSVDAPEQTGSASATGDDPGLDGGFYWLFSSLTGGHQFTAAAGSYAELTRRAEVEPDWTTRRNFRLAAGQLAVEPGAVETEVPLGESTQESLTITNTGTAPAQVELSERGGEFEILRADGSRLTERRILASPGAPVHRIPLDAPLSELVGASAPANLGATVTPEPAPAPAQESWQALPVMPRGIMDNNAVLVDGQLYSFGGTDGSAPVADTYVYDVVEQTWSRAADAPAPVQQSAQGVIDGLVYLAGGFTFDPGTLVYDPAAGSWSSGADMPEARAAAGAAVLDGQLYVVGGCTTGSCAPFGDSVFRYDPGGDTWETLAPYPEPAAFLSCGGVQGVLVCAGGVNDTGGLASTYVFDPDSGQWEQRADLPVDLWGSAYQGANDLLLVSGGAALDGSVITNEGYAYDPAADSWTDLPAGNHSLYRSGSACGFYRVGGSSGDFNETDLVEVLPGFTECAAVTDVPWLSMSPTTATLEPGDSVEVTVSMAADVAQPGAYTAGIRLGEDTPYRAAPVDVTMTVTPPESWGKLTGTVRATDCDGEQAPLADATVHLSTWVMELTRYTDQAGGYAHWLDWRHSPITMIVAKDGYQPRVREVEIVAGEVTVEDFVLKRVCAGSARDPHPV